MLPRVYIIGMAGFPGSHNADAIGHVLEDDALRAKLRAGAGRRAAKRDWQIVAQQTSGVYR